MFCSVILLQNKCSVSSFMILRVAAFENLKIIQVPVKGPDHQKYLRQSTFPWKCKLLICSFIAKVVLKVFFTNFLLRHDTWDIILEKSGVLWWSDKLTVNNSIENGLMYIVILFILLARFFIKELLQTECLQDISCY